MLNLTLLGSGGGMPMPNRFLSSLLINYKGRKILIDCGEGTQVAMRKMNTGFKSLDIICITHLHGDHIFGLPGLLSTMGNSGRILPVTIIGPLGLRQVIEGMMVAISYLPFEIYIIEEPNNILNISNSIDGLKIYEENIKNIEITIATLNLMHSSPCIGYSFYVKRKPKFLHEKAKDKNIPKIIWNRLQNEETVELNNKIYTPNMVLGEEREGIKLSFVTDTRPFDEIINFIKNSDLFVCESTYIDEKDFDKAVMNKHMTSKEASYLATNANVKKMLLTHFSTSIDNPQDMDSYVKTLFNNTIIGFDGWNGLLEYSKDNYM